MSEAGQILDASKTTTDPATTVTTSQAPIVPKEEPISGKLSVLMERERQALNRERMAKAQEEKLRDVLEFREKIEGYKKDPTKVEDLLKELGWDYDKLTQAKLSDGQVPPSVEIQKLRDEIDSLKGQLKQDKDLEVEARKNHILHAENKAVSDFKSEIGEYLKGQADRYELIDFEGAHDLVYDVIDEHYNRTIDQATGVGKIMSIAEASDKVEEHLEKKYLSAKEKNKVKAFWSNMPKPIQQHVEKQRLEDKPQSQPPKTLTNNMGPRTPQKVARPPEDQRIRQIVAEQVAKMRNQYA